MDAISGFINPMLSRIEYLNVTKNWSDVLIECTPELNCAINQNKFHLPILKRNGMLSLAKSAMDPIGNSEIDYEVYWRLCSWDTAIEDHSTNNLLSINYEAEFQKNHYNALKCIANREENNSLAAIERARQAIASTLQGISIECLQSLYKYLSWMELLQQADDFCSIQFGRGQAVKDILENWHVKTEHLRYGNFQCRETMLSHQMVLFETAGIRAKRKIQDFYKVRGGIY